MDSVNYGGPDLDETLYETPWDINQAYMYDTADNRGWMNNNHLLDPDLEIYESLGVTRNDHNFAFSINQDMGDLRRFDDDACILATPEYSINADDADTASIANSSSPRSLRHWLIVPICLLYFGGFLVSFITMQQFVYRKIQQDEYPNITFNSSIPVCDVNESDPNYIRQTEVQQKSAMWILYLGLASSIPAIFSNLILGSLTDRFGRKYLLFLASAGSLTRLAINAIAIYFDVSLYGFIPSCILDGLTGSAYVIVSVSFSYIADITQAGPSRTFRITIVEFSIGLGSAVFGVLAGYLVENVSFFWAMVTAALIIALTIVLIILLPESFPKTKRASSTKCSNMLTALTFFFGRSNAGKRWLFNVLILTFLFSHVTSSNVETLYLLNNPFCWDPEQISWYFGSSSALLIVGLIIVKPLQRMFSGETIVILGCCSAIASYVIKCVAQSSGMLYVGKYNSLSLSLSLSLSETSSLTLLGSL